MLKLLPSDPLFPAWDWLLTMRAQWINAACFCDLRQEPEVERRAMIVRLSEEMRETFEELTR